MRILEKEFTKKGFIHKQVWREENLAIYKRWKDGGLEPHFEVIKIKSHNGFALPDGNMSEPGEYYPSENSWGRDGFTFFDLTNAEEKVKYLQVKSNEKN